MLVLSREDIARLVSYEEVLAAVREAYMLYEEGNFHMPDRIHLDYGNKTLLYMPCFLDGVFGTKMLTVFPDNAARGIPALDGLMLLNDMESGAPLCLADGKTVTSLRTGAVGGLGVAYTTPETVRSVGLVGAGVQGYYQLVYACKVRDFGKILLYNARRKDYSDFIARLRREIPSDIEIMPCEHINALLEQAEVVITATNATEPVLPADETLLRGKHFIGIGSYKPSMREFPDALYPLLKQVYIDADYAAAESGDLADPLEAGLLKREQLRRFGKLLQNPKEREIVAKETTLFKSVGMAVFDVVTARLLYEKAREQGVGYQL